MRSRQLARLIGLLVALIAVVGLGLLLWLPDTDPPTRRSDLGGAVIGGALVALTFLFLDWAATSRSDAAQLRLILTLERNTEGIRLDRRDLEDMYLVRRNFTRASLRKAKLRNAVLYRSVLIRADLTGADLCGADVGRVVLRKARLEGTRLNDCDLGWADLRDADLSGTRGLGSAKLEKAVFNDQTVWPQGFDHNAAGAVHQDKLSKEPDVGPEGYGARKLPHPRP